MQNGIQSQLHEKFLRIAGAILNSEVENWKKPGGRVMGYTCSFVPEELFIAAGLLPFRIRATGSVSAGLGDDYFAAANICSQIRHIFGKVLSGEYDFLDGAVIGGGCDGNRHILDNWKRCNAKTPFLDTIFFPHASGAPMAAYFRDELAALKTRMEEHFGVSVTDQKLWAAIKLCNETRALQKELYALRKAANPPITGAETIAVMVAGTSMPKAQYNSELKQLIADLRGAKVPAGTYKARLMIVGPGHDDPALCDIIESLGALVATDLTCFGGKLIVGGVKESGPEPLQAIADYQVLDRPLCPKNLGAQLHIDKEVLDATKDFKIDGVIGQNYLCCDMWGGALYLLNKKLKEVGIPMLRIERECIADSTGQLRTRIQAFIETITGGVP